jgi:predicted MFS family arabinose efflux permease
VGDASIVITAFGIAYGVLQLVNGPLSDRIGKYRMVCWVTGISAIGNLACALAPSLPLLILARFSTGAVVGAIVPLAIAWIGDTIAYEQRQAMLARFLIGHTIGIGIATMASGWLGEQYGWRAIYYALAAMYVLSAALLFAELRRNPATRQAPAPAEPWIRGYARMLGLLRLPWVRSILLIGFAEGGLMYGASSFTAFHVHIALGLSLAASGAMVALSALGGLSYASAAGRMVRLLGERGLVLAGGSCLAAGFLGLALAPSAGWAAPCIFLFGLGIIMLHNTLQVHATQMAPEARGSAMALFAFFLFTGQSTGVWLASRVVDSRGTVPVFVVSGVGLLLLALYFRRRISLRKPASG